MSIEAMKFALNALEEYQAKGAPFMSCDAAVAVLRAAIEQAAQPCPYIRTSGNTHWCALAAAPADQQPVAWMYTSHLKGNERYITRYQTDLTTYKADKVWPLYTAPRQWVGLTNKDIIEMWPETSTVGWDDIRLIEAKLKEKNT